MSDLPECINGLPNICGSEQTVADAVRVGLDQPVQSSGSPIDFNRIKVPAPSRCTCISR